MFFTGFTKAVGEGLAETRKTNARKAELDAARENRMLELLSQSDDPEIASMALAGMLDQTTRKPRKGLRGFLGEMEGHPALPTIRQLIQAGQSVPNEPGSPGLGGPTPPAALDINPEGAPPAASSMGSAAMPGTSAVTPGAPPLRMPPGPVSFHQAPRTVFLSPEERARRQQEATVGGKLTAFRQGMREAQTDEERDLVRGLSGAPRRLPNNRQLTLELDNGDGTTTTTAGYFDTQTGHYFDENGAPLTNVKRIVPNTGGSSAAAGLKGQKIKDPSSPTGWSQVYTKPDGTEAYRVKGATPYTPPPAFSGTTTVVGDEGEAVVSGIPRYGGAPVPLGERPAPAGGVTPDQALAQGVVAAIDKAIADQRIPGVPIQPGLRDRLVKQRNQQFGKNWTYEQWVAQAKMPGAAQGVSGGPPPPPRKPGAKTKGKGTTPAKGPANDPLGIRPGG